MSLRKTLKQRAKDEVFDVAIIGGGINGAVAAAALAARGVRTVLVEKKDFASYTSQESSNLAWGGIKYLESYEFGLVWGLCRSRNRLLSAFPSQVKEIRFSAVLPKVFRKPRFLVYLGSWLYWIMGRGFTERPRALNRRDLATELPLVNLEETNGGVEYSDAYFIDNDSRFVFKFIRKAIDYGAVTLNYTKLSSGSFDKDTWTLLVQDQIDQQKLEIKAKAVVNATGPFADEICQMLSLKTNFKHIFSKGIHLIVPQLTGVTRVLTFFASDGRMFFVIPMGPRSCIGTTDTPVKTLPATVTMEDREFVLNNINRLLNLTKPLTKEDVIAERCGVRPLVTERGGPDETDDWLKLSRKHEMSIDRSKHALTIYGGKLTDCINVGEEVCDIVRQFSVSLPKEDADWFGEPSQAVKDEYFKQARAMQLDNFTASSSSEPLSLRLWRRYGLRALEILEDIRQDKRMGDLLIEGAEYIRAELHYAAKSELIVTLEDFLRRRSKIALVKDRESIRNAPGMLEACKILFGEPSEQKFNEYFIR